MLNATRCRRARTVPPLVLTLLALVAGSVTAQAPLGSDVAEGICGERLQAAYAALDDRERGDPTRVATTFARVAFDALEPAYPATSPGDGIGDSNAAWLARRGWLPGSWREAQWTADAWHALLAGLRRPYGLEPASTSGASDPATLAREVQAALATAASTMRPLAMIGVDRASDGPDRVAFANVIWNWTPHPRLLTFDLSGRAVAFGSATPELLSEMGTCAWLPRAWILAPARAARDFYTGNVAVTMRILASDARELASFTTIARGDEEAALRLEHPVLEDATVAALGFSGPGPSLGTVLRLAMSIRTNLGLFEVSHYLQFPP